MDSGEWIAFMLSNPPNASNDRVDEDWNLRLAGQFVETFVANSMRPEIATISKFWLHL